MEVSAMVLRIASAVIPISLLYLFLRRSSRKSPHYLQVLVWYIWVLLKWTLCDLWLYVSSGILKCYLYWHLAKIRYHVMVQLSLVSWYVHQWSSLVCFRLPPHLKRSFMLTPFAGESGGHNRGEFRFGGGLCQSIPLHRMQTRSLWPKCWHAATGCDSGAGDACYHWFAR